MEKWIIDSAMVRKPFHNQRVPSWGELRLVIRPPVFWPRRACAPSSAPPVNLPNFSACGGPERRARSAPRPGPWPATRVWVSTGSVLRGEVRMSKLVVGLSPLRVSGPKLDGHCNREQEQWGLCSPGTFRSSKSTKQKCCSQPP